MEIDLLKRRQRPDIRSPVTIRETMRLGTLVQCAALLLCSCAKPHYADPFPHRVVRPLAVDVRVCEALRVALDSVMSGRARGQVILAPVTFPINAATRVQHYRDQLIALPGLLAQTWQSFEEQNVAAQPGCPASNGTRDMRQGPGPGAGLHPREWSEHFRTIYPSAEGWVLISSPGLNDDGTQVLLVLQVVFSDGANAEYAIVLNRVIPANGWRIRSMRTESLVE